VIKPYILNNGCMPSQFPISSPYPFERNKGVRCGSFYFRRTPTIFVIFVLDVAIIEKLVEVHNKHIEGQDFVVNFEVCKRDLFFSFWLANFFMKFPI